MATDPPGFRPLSARPSASLSCPTPHGYDQIVLGHGSGGRLTRDLIERLFLPAWNTPRLAQLEDQATVDLPPGRLAFTTDSFVVNPIFFPGGDIGQLAVNGTVNDLAVGGAQPLFLSAAFILEEGLPLDTLRQIVASMREACRLADVEMITGDTKVVDKGKGDQIFITTAGVGVTPYDRRLSITAAQPGDKILISGSIGDHGIAILSVRESLEFETKIESDTASLAHLTQTMLEACSTIRGMRDPTRGGLAGTLNELAVGSRVGVSIFETALPIKPQVSAACDLLGLDPLYVANEGKLVAVVPTADAEPLLEVMRQHPLGRESAIIGEVQAEPRDLVTMQTRYGGRRLVPLLAGEQLPRIC